jgi:outer membrane protein assembly factor BamB
LVVDDIVLMRTYRNLLALDFNSGKRLWDVPVDEASESSVNSTNDFDAPFRQNVGGNALNPASMQGILAVGRASDDSLFGTLSSDGQLVYSIEDASSNGAASARSVAMNARQLTASGGPAVFNYLAARDIRSGKLKWAIGGPSDQFALPQPDTFFLGPPLPLLGQLYVIGEVKGEIRLFVLDPAPEKKRDRIVWSQQLAIVERGVQEDALRRSTGISPSYADGILICPTSTGALVAVDLATRSLLWGYHYGREIRDNYSAFAGGQFMPNPYGIETSRWADSSVTIAGGRVLVASVDSDDLHCLNLADGELKWKNPRQTDLYIACVFKDNVIVVGEKKVHAYRLEDGKAAWDGRAVDLPEGALPSGRGFLSDDKYYLPLSSAEVADIDLSEGKIERFSKSQKGNVPGNLVCYKGRVLSQNYRGLEVFYQLDAALADVASRLSANPRDAEAFCLRGEILLDAGKRDEAIECYRKAYEIASEPRTKLLLRDSLLEGLRTQFAAYRKRGGEIEKLLENSAQRAAYLRLMIAGLEKEEDIKAAFEQCQLLVDLDPGRPPLDPLSKMQWVRRDRWIQARLDALRSHAKAEFLPLMDAAISARFMAEQSEGSIEGLKTFLGYFGNQPTVAPARAELIDKLKKSGRPLEVELALWQSQPDLSPLIGGSALADAGEYFRQIGQTDAAVASYRWLLSRYGDVLSKGGKTGRQIVEAISTADPLRKAIDRRDDWPTGRVDYALSTNENFNERINYGRVPLEFRGNRGPYFDDLNLVYDQNQNRMSILCLDAFGNEIWQFPLNEDNQFQNQLFAVSRDGSQVRAWGHVLLIPMGGRLVAIDTLAADKTHPPKVLWTEDGNDDNTDTPKQPQFGGRINPAALNLGLQQIAMSYGSNRSAEANLLTNRYLCVQRSRTLRAINPTDGQTLWQRESIPLYSTIFGDDQYVFVLPVDKPEAMVFRALDGELVGSRKIERREIHAQRPDGVEFIRYGELINDCKAAFGRNLLFWRQKGDRRTLEMFDVWEQKNVWPLRSFSSKAQYDLVNREVLGIAEPNGKFTLISLPDGRTLAETQLEPNNDLSQVSVIPYEDSYLILTNSPLRIPVNSNQANPVTGSGDKPIMRGRLYAIDRQGKLLWPEAVKITNQHLIAGQAKGFPVLVFASQIYEVPPNKPGKIRLAVQLIDKRTGRVALDKPDLPQPGFFKVSADPEKKTMQIALQKNTLTLTFTDKAWPTKEELEKMKAEEKKKSPPKLLKALRNAAENMEDMFKIPSLDIMGDE